MRIPFIAVLAALTITLVILVSRAVTALTGDGLSAVLVVLILTIAIVSLFTRGEQPRRGNSCG